MNPLTLAGLAAAVVLSVAPAGCGEPVHVGAASPRPATVAPAGPALSIDPTRNADCAHAATAGAPERVDVVKTGSTDFVDAGSAQWWESQQGTCAGYAWVVLTLDGPTVYFSQVQSQYGGRVDVHLSSPGVSAAIVDYQATVRAGGASVLTTTAVLKGKVPAWAQSGLYPLKFVAEPMFFMP